MSFNSITFTGNVERNWFSISQVTVRSSLIQQIALSWVFYPGTSCNIPSTRPLLIRWLRRSTWPLVSLLSSWMMQDLHFLSQEWCCLSEKSLCGSVLAHTEQILKLEDCCVSSLKKSWCTDERAKPSEDTLWKRPTCTGSPFLLLPLSWWVHPLQLAERTKPSEDTLWVRPTCTGLALLHPCPCLDDENTS